MSKQNVVNQMFFDESLLRAAEKLVANIRFYRTTHDLKTINVVSADKNEGKTIVASSMACAFAKQGSPTLLIDADVHQRSISRALTDGKHFGLFDILERQCPLEQGISSTPIDNLYFLDCGRSYASIPELLSHKEFDNIYNCLKQNFEFIVFDTPPVLFCSDSALISSISDVSILIVRENKSIKKNVKTALNQLSIAKANIIGSVLTCSSTSQKYYYSSYYK